MRFSFFITVYSVSEDPSYGRFFSSVIFKNRRILLGFLKLIIRVCSMNGLCRRRAKGAFF